MRFIHQPHRGRTRPVAEREEPGKSKLLKEFFHSQQPCHGNTLAEGHVGRRNMLSKGTHWWAGGALFERPAHARSHLNNNAYQSKHIN